MTPRAVRRAAGALLLVLTILVLALVSSPGDAAAVTSTTRPAAPSTSVAPTAGVKPATTSTTNPARAVAAGAPPIHGATAILINTADGRVLYEKRADARRPIASTTKIMTGILAIETLSPDAMVKASKHATEAGESEIWLTPGEELSVHDLLYGLLVKSGNDAAVALGEASAGTEKAFVARMNAKAAELGLTNTHFITPHGLDDKAYSSARDLAILGRYAMQNPLFAKIVGTAKVTIPWPGKPYDRILENHNQLLGKEPFVTGIKTGYTADAGYCFVGAGTRDGVSLVSVVLGGRERDPVFADSAKLMEWGFDQYRQVVLAEKGASVAEVDVPYHYGEKLPLVTEKGLETSVFQDEVVTRTVSVQSGVTLPVRAGQQLGTVTYQVGGKPAGEVALVATRDIEEATLRVKMQYLFDRVGAWMGWRA